MAILTYNDFTGQQYLPHTSAVQQSALTAAIAEHYRDGMVLVLGDKLADAIIADYAQNTPAQATLDLVDGGVDFDITIGGTTVQRAWKGLKSPLTKYVYLRYREQTDSFMTSAAGQSVGKAENAAGADPIPVMCKIHNEMVKEFGHDCVATFDGLTDVLIKPDAGDSFANYDPSAYNFMLANIADYPDWIFTPMQMVNRFGL